jgi:hypothetical protein
MTVHCVSPIAVHTGLMFRGETIWSGDGYELLGAREPCQYQCCAGHKWTICGDCGRSGDRPGDECERPCTPYTPETP